MKKALLTLAALATATSAFAQGTINFFNNNLTGATGTYRAGIFRHDPNDYTHLIGAGAGYTAGLFLASDLSTPLATQTFRTTTAQEVLLATVPDVPVPTAPPGTTATLVVAAWSTFAGSFLNARTTPGAEWGMQTFTSRALGGPNPDPTQPAIPSPDLGPGFTGFVMDMPEPTTVALGMLGVGALVFARRRK